jgi:hypothetical protein
MNHTIRDDAKSGWTVWDTMNPAGDSFIVLPAHENPKDKVGVEHSSLFNYKEVSTKQTLAEAAELAATKNKERAALAD